MTNRASVRRTSHDPFRVVYVTAAPSERDSSDHNLATVLATAFPNRFAGRIELAVYRYGDGGFQPAGNGARLPSRERTDLLLTSTPEFLEAAMADIGTTAERSFYIENLSARLSEMAEERDSRHLPPLDRDGIAVFCDRMIRYAAGAQIVSDSPIASSLSSRAASSDATRIARFTDSIRRLSVGGLPQSIRDPRITAGVRLREVFATS